MTPPERGELTPAGERRRPLPASEADDPTGGTSRLRTARALGLRGAPPRSGGRFPDGGGRYGAAAHDPILGWYEPDAPTVEMAIVDELREAQSAAPLDGRSGPAGTTVSVPVRARAPGEPPPVDEATTERSSRRASLLVGAGIMLSRCAGLVREVLIGRYLGTTAAGDAFKAALRIPNTLQNLLGEGVLSASFIPVYARMRAEGDEEAAGRLAGAICALLLALSGVLTLIGVVFTEQVTAVLVTGFAGDDRYDLTVRLVRVMFPAMGLMPLSAWCLGVLNSHRKFFLSYVAPVLWNAGQIAALLAVAVAGAGEVELAEALAWGVLAGSIGEVAVQLPSVLRALGGLHLSLSTRVGGVRTVLTRFGPVVMGRGVVQVMGYVHLWLASFLAVGAVSSLTYAQVLYLLPISVFGMSVAAAELPDLSRVEVHDLDTRRAFRRRMEGGMARILFFVAPTATLFIVVGDVIVRLLFQRGEFSSADTYAVWLVMACFSLGLPATTASRMLQNALYALGDARTPARLAMVRVIVGTVIGLALMYPLDRLTIEGGRITGWGDVLAFGPLADALRRNPGSVPHLGIAGLAIGAAVSAWFEYRLLSTAIAWRIGRSRLGGRWIDPIAVACAAAAVTAYLAELAVGDRSIVMAAPLVLGPAALVYLLVARRFGVPEATSLTNQVLARLGRGSRAGARR